jgi:hypothetical protein
VSPQYLLIFSKFFVQKLTTFTLTMASPTPPGGTHAGILRLARNDAAHLPKSLSPDSDLATAAVNLKADSAGATTGGAPRLAQAALARKRVLTMGTVLALDVGSSPSLAIASLGIVFLQVWC